MDHSDINDYLLARKWDFEEAEPAINGYNASETWAFRTNSYGMTAQGFFEITYNGQGNIRVRYQHSKPEIYASLKAEISANNMEKVKSGIYDDGGIYTDYVGQNYAVRLTTEKDMLNNKLFCLMLYHKDHYYRTRYYD